MATEAQKRAMKRYNEKTKQFVFRFHQINDAAVIKKLSETCNKTGYVRKLIVEDVASSECETEE